MTPRATTVFVFVFVSVRCGVPNRRSKFCNYTSLDTIFIEANMEQAKEAGAAPETEAAKAAKAANNMKTLCRFEFLEVRSSSERHVCSHKARLPHHHNEGQLLSSPRRVAILEVCT